MLIGTGCSEVREGKSKASFLSRILGWGPTSGVDQGSSWPWPFTGSVLFRMGERWGRELHFLGVRWKEAGLLKTWIPGEAIHWLQIKKPRKTSMSKKDDWSIYPECPVRALWSPGLSDRSRGVHLTRPGRMRRNHLFLPMWLRSFALPYGASGREKG